MERGGERLERHLAAEAQYAAQALQLLGPLQQQLHEEMLAQLPTHQVRYTFLCMLPRLLVRPAQVWALCWCFGAILQNCSLQGST